MKLTTEENLRMENEVLKLEKAQLLKAMYGEKVAQAEKDEQTAISNLATLRNEFAAKYNMPPDQLRVAKDGTLVLVGPTGQPIAPPAPAPEQKPDLTVVPGGATA